ncbi:uncharacterized protein LOC117781561 [Drosophila innubila]|uniref:uncharacterized protein LOC117781561 n=1 Tax=Drosophila innubila TaxID=198719 RepID=UPI00148DD11E|nr:uncharacterized protein LOC117781561 [Drosophila innubila]
MMLNPIEIICYYLVQPIVDLLAYLLNDVHYLAFLAAICVIGVLLGLVMGIITLICFKYQGVEEPKQKLQNEEGIEIQSNNNKLKSE